MSTKCFYALSHCLSGNCSCFKAKVPCSRNCQCRDCQNTVNNTAEIEWRHREYLKRKSPVVPENLMVPTVPTGARPVPPGFKGCNSCTRTKCANGKCPCFRNAYGCTSKCKCQDCANPEGIGGGDTNTEPGQGGAGGVSNVPNEANIESEQTGDTSSTAEEPAQIEEHPAESTDNRGSDRNKRAKKE